MIRRLLAVSLFAVAAQGALAESQRAFFTRENRFPETGKAEVGGIYQYKEYDDRDESYVAPYGRYTIIDNLTINAAVPYGWVSPDFGDDESGLGDTTIGLELLAYQDIFEYPWVIPHVDLGLETGDEDEGLGQGETVTTFGVSVGTTVYDELHYVVDVSYAVDGGSEKPDPDNVLIFGGSIIWDVSEKFAVLVEGQATDEDNEEDDVPLFFQAGMTYAFTEAFVLSWYGGADASGDDGQGEDMRVTVKGAYTF